MIDRTRVIRIPESYTLTVVLPVRPGRAPQQVVIEGRVAKMIDWLVQHRKLVEELGVGRLVFDLGLNRFTPSVQQGFPSVPATPEEVPQSLTG